MAMFYLIKMRIANMWFSEMQMRKTICISLMWGNQYKR